MEQASVEDPYRPVPVLQQQVFCRTCVHRGSYPYAETCYSMKVPCPINGTRVVERKCVEVNENFDCSDFKARHVTPTTTRTLMLVLFLTSLIGSVCAVGYCILH